MPRERSRMQSLSGEKKQFLLAAAEVPHAEGCCGRKRRELRISAGDSERERAPKLRWRQRKGESSEAALEAAPRLV